MLWLFHKSLPVGITYPSKRCSYIFEGMICKKLATKTFKNLKKSDCYLGFLKNPLKNVKGINLLDISRNHLNKRMMLKKLRNGNGFDDY